jgi:hypothetical protein
LFNTAVVAKGYSIVLRLVKRIRTLARRRVIRVPRRGGGFDCLLKLTPKDVLTLYLDMFPFHEVPYSSFKRKLRRAFELMPEVTRVVPSNHGYGTTYRVYIRCSAISEDEDRGGGGG